MCKPALGRAEAAVGAVAGFAAATCDVGHEELRAASERLACEVLQVLEASGRRCVGFLLGALARSADAGPEATHDTIWMLTKVAQRGGAAVASWIREAGGLAMIQASLAAHPDYQTLIQDGVWLVFEIDGLRGLATLLQVPGPTPQGQQAVHTAVAWAVFDFVQKRTDDAGALQPEAPTVLALLLAVMAHEHKSPSAQWGCIAALDAMVKFEPRLGALLLERGGGPVLRTALRAAATMGGTEGVDFRRAGCYLTRSLTDGCSCAALESLKGGGELVAILSGDAFILSGGQDTEAALWSLGMLDGVQSVMAAMSRAGNGNTAAIRGGLSVISSVVSHSLDDRDALSRLPMTLAMMLELLGKEGVLVGAFVQYMQALGAVVQALAPYVPPGQMPHVDRAVEALLERLHASAAIAGVDPGNGNAPREGGAAEVAAEAIGRVALVAPKWRDALAGCGALESLTRWLRCEFTPQRLKRYLLWAAAAIAGLPLVAAELRRAPESADVVDACLVTIGHILDGDIDGEYALVGVERCTDSDLTVVMALVVDAMRTHTNEFEIQCSACQCVELILPHIPTQAAHTAARAIIAAVVSAQRRFPRHQRVVRDACAALRGFCFLAKPGTYAADGSEMPVLAALRAEGAAECAEQALDDYGACSGAGLENELLENASSVLVLLLGVEAALERFAKASPGSALRAAGFKALFEVCRAHVWLLSGRASAAVAEATAKMVAEEPAAEGATRLRQAAELLAGLCGAARPATGDG